MKGKVMKRQLTAIRIPSLLCLALLAVPPIVRGSGCYKNLGPTYCALAGQDCGTTYVEILGHACLNCKYCSAWIPGHVVATVYRDISEPCGYMEPGYTNPGTLQLCYYLCRATCYSCNGATTEWRGVGGMSQMPWGDCCVG
jgi:hypothetical protein